MALSAAWQHHVFAGGEKVAGMGPIRTLIVDDSAVVRRIIQDVLSSDNDVEVIDVAENGKIGVEKAKELRPDIITMDIEMPFLNGIEAVKALRRAGLKCPIIMFSTLTAAGATATMEALAAGASDFVTKPGNVGTIVESMAAVRQELIPKMKALTGRGGGPRVPSQAARPGRPKKTLKDAMDALGAAKASGENDAAPSVPAPRTGAKPALAPRAIVIGSSTGGPQALSEVLSNFPRDVQVPVFIVQHMPPVFTTQLAARLDRECPLPVVEAEHGMPAKPGHVYLAPGDYHMVVENENRSLAVKLNQNAQENFCRPAVDVLFRSASTTFGSATLAIVLTGMGSDGCIGAGLIQSAGGYVIAQDEASSVVWGMPGAVVKAGFADKTTDLKSIAPHMRERLMRSSASGSQGKNIPVRGK